jgi:protein O-mannosyl-transferase
MNKVSIENKTTRWKSLEYWAISWRPYLIIVVAGLLVFGRTAFFGFTYFDDDIFILKHFSSIEKLSAIPQAFSESYFGAYYRPLVTVSLILDAQISGIAPWMYHCSNIIYHLLVSCLVFVILTKLGIKKSISMAMSVFFSIHPLVTQSVAWILGRNETLLLVFVLLSMITYIDYSTTGRSKYLLLHLLFFVIALLAKETAVVIPLLVISYQLFIARESRIKKSYMVWAGWVLIIIGWYFLRQAVAKGTAIDADVFSLTTFGANIRVLFEAVGKIFLPLRLSSYPTFRMLPTIVGMISIVAISIYIYVIKGNNRRLALFAISWMILFILPSLFVQIFDAGNRFNYLESRFYGSLIGAFVFTSGITQKYLIQQRWMRTKIVLIVIILFAILSISYSNVFHDPISHWEDATVMSPRAADVYYSTAVMMTEFAKQPDRAKENYIKAISLNDANPKYHYNLGTIYAQQNRTDSALVEFERTSELDPNNPAPVYNMAYLYMKSGNLMDAERYLKRTLAIDSNFVYAEMNLVELYMRQGRVDEARYYQDRLQSAGYEFRSKLKGSPNPGSK